VCGDEPDLRDDVRRLDPTLCLHGDEHAMDVAIVHLLDDGLERVVFVDVDGFRWSLTAELFARLLLELFDRVPQPLEVLGLDPDTTQVTNTDRVHQMTIDVGDAETTDALLVHKTHIDSQ
jgi:hypothetical protein